MNTRIVAFWEKSAEVGLLLLAFVLPLAFYLKTYETATVKDLTLQAGGVLILAFAFLRHVEAGRFELPAGRTGFAALAATLLLWIAVSYAMNPFKEASLFGAAQLGLSVGLFLVVLTGPASVSFGAALSGWTLAAAAIAAVYALLQALGIEPFSWSWAFGNQAMSTLANPELLGVFLGAAFPLGLSRFLDPEGSRIRRGAALTATLLCAFGVVVSGSPVGAVALCTGALAFAFFAASRFRHAFTRTTAVVSAACAPAALWLMFRSLDLRFAERCLREWTLNSTVWSGAKRLILDHAWTGVGAGGFATAFPPYRPQGPLYVSDTSINFVNNAHSLPLNAAAELGVPALLLGAALFVGVLWLSLKDAARRDRDGETRAAVVILGQWAALAALLAAGCVGYAPLWAAPGLLVWLLAGSLAGLATERGSATVRVLSIPAPASLRRLLYAPAAAVVSASLLCQGSFFRSDIDHNIGVYRSRRQQWARAIERYGRVSKWHSSGVMARYRAAGSHLNREESGDLRRAVALYEEVESLSPHYVRTAYYKAVAHEKLQEWRQARESLKAYIALDPLYAPAYRRLAEVSVTLGDPEAARQAALQLVRIEPDNPEHWRFLAEQYHSQRRFRTARLMFEKAELVHALAESGRMPSPVY
ncbi:MAG: tetratricopeptide repeat protein [Elusimicrobiota bacterium]